MEEEGEHMDGLRVWVTVRMDSWASRQYRQQIALNANVACSGRCRCLRDCLLWFRGTNDIRSGV